MEFWNWSTFSNASLYWGKLKLDTTMAKTLFKTDRISLSFSVSVSLKMAKFYSVKRSFTYFQEDLLSTTFFWSGLLQFSFFTFITRNRKFSSSFFSIWIFFHNHSWTTELQGKDEGVSLNPHYHFHLLHRHLDISRVITAETSICT